MVIFTSRLILLDHVLVHVAVPPSAWIEASAAGAGLRREVLGIGALGVEVLLAGVEPLGGVLDRRAPRLEAHDVGDDQLVRVALLLASGPPPGRARAE